MPEHLSRVVEFRHGRFPVKGVLNEGPYHSRGALGSHRNPLSPLGLKRVHLFLDDIGGVAETR